MLIRFTCLWLSVLFVLVSTGNGQQYTRGGGWLVQNEEQERETSKIHGIEKVKTLAAAFSTDTSSERYHQDPKVLTGDAKNIGSKDNEGNPTTKPASQSSLAPMSLTRSQLNGLSFSAQDHSMQNSRQSANSATTERDLHQVTNIQRKKCDGIQKIVHCKSEVPEETCKQDLVDNGVDIVSDMKGTIFFAICVNTLEEMDLVSKLTLVENIEDDPPRYPSYIPGSTVVRTLQVGEQVVPYGVELVKAPEFWDVYGSRGAGIKVCVIDTGLRASHEDLVGANITASEEGFVSPWDEDIVSHGTHVTGTIAARDNGFGVIGVAPDVMLHVVRIYDDDGTSSSSSLIEAMAACYDAGADIINMSLGGPIPSSAERSTARILGNLGVLLVAASGNDGDKLFNFIQYPAGYEDVMSVGAVDDKMRIAEFSTYNIYVDVVAPGVEVLSLDSESDTDYSLKNGTSMAAPHVSAIAALLWSEFPYLGVDTLRTAILESAKDIGACGYDTVYGSGMVDVMAAAAFVENITAAAPELESCLEVQVNLTIDVYGNETTYLVTQEGRPKKIYTRGGPYNFGQPGTIIRTFPLQDGCYDLILRDYFGDGIILDDPENTVITITYAGVEQVNDNDFTSSEKVYTFGNCGRRSLSLGANTINGCGDGIVDVGEECDDANSDNDDACLNDCTSARCGDGYLHSDIEECDDGNDTDGDGCSSSCIIEKQYAPEAPTCSAGETLLRFRLAGDKQAHHDNSLYLYGDDSQDEEYIWYAGRFDFEPSSEYVGYACLRPSACYRFFFFDVMGDGLLAGGLTLTTDGNLIMRISPGDVGTGDGNQAIPGTYWSESFGPCITTSSVSVVSGDNLPAAPINGTSPI